MQIAHKLFVHDHWQIGIVKKRTEDIITTIRENTSDIIWLPEESGHYYADPFLVEKENVLYIFFEDYNYANNAGSLAYMTFDGTTFGSKKMILDAPFHQSYPYMFLYRGKYYCLPEQSESGKLTLYKAIDFPDVWVEEKVLISEPCVDASILYFDQRWWIFTAMAGEDVNQALSIFYAADLLGKWRPHSDNPVKLSISSARPAGSFFRKGDALYRPSQNCKKTYGGDTMINKITALTPDDFSERLITNVGLLRDDIFGTHTLSSSPHYIAFDAKHKAIPTEVFAKYRAYTRAQIDQRINSHK